MVDIGISQPITVALPSQAVQASQQAGPVIKTVPASSVLPPDGIPDQVGYSAQAAEQKRVDTVKAISQQIANTFVVGDQEFAIFKDATGQYITRFTSLRDGKVTYIPEPVLYKLGSSFAPAVQLKV